MKVLRPELCASLGAERFLREIEIVAGLRHPHILPLYDSGEADGFLYYVMPLVEGETLRERIERERQLPIDDALRFAREVADALAYAHARGVVHRDIKPENILIEGDHAVVADFGIAKAVAAAGHRTTLTRSGMAIGTPAYMSPEQAAGDTDIDGRSDLYSLACVVYEIAGRAAAVHRGDDGESRAPAHGGAAAARDAVPSRRTGRGERCADAGARQGAGGPVQSGGAVLLRARAHDGIDRRAHRAAARGALAAPPAHDGGDRPRRGRGGHHVGDRESETDRGRSQRGGSAPSRCCRSTT